MIYPLDQLSNCDGWKYALGCWGEFAVGSPNTGLTVTSTALKDGISVSGVVGYGFVAGEIADDMVAAYTGTTSCGSTVHCANYLSVSGKWALLSYGLCAAGEGGGEVASYVEASDSIDSPYQSDLNSSYCVSLLTRDASRRTAAGCANGL